MCAALAGACILTLSMAGSASAGEWVQVSCINPNQTAAGSAGWSSFAAGGGYGSNNGTNCGPSSPAFAILSTDAPVVVGSEETLQYTPPAGSTLNGGLLDIGMYADGRGYGASGTAVAYTPAYAYDGSNVFFQCASGLTPCAAGTNDFTGQLEIPTGRGGNLYLEAGCGGESSPNLRSCDEGGSNGAWSLIDLWWANLRLSNNAAPGASGVSGTLLEPEARGARELLLSASDPAGPGVYNITVQAGGQTLYNATPDSNDGQCVPVGDSDGALMFDADQPCKQSETVEEPIETTALSDGEHTLKVSVTDAAQNTSVVYDQTITTHNAPEDSSAPTITSPGALQSGSTLTAAPGQWLAPAGTGTTTYSYQWQDCNAEGDSCEAVAGADASSYTATATDVGHTLRALITAADNDGSSSTASAASSVVASPPPSASTNTQAPANAAVSAANATLALTTSPVGATPNGAGPSEAAQLQIAGQTAISRSYAARAFTITGQLANASGASISRAILDVREQAQGASSPQVIAHATTATNGNFTVRVPAGGTRLILIDYRAFSTDAGYSAQAGVQENVGAGVQMHITPQRTSSTGRIVLAGHVSGPVPAQGVVVELLVRYRGVWEPLRTPRTNADGHFQTAYQFQGALGTYPFRAEVFGGQAGFPYGSGESTPVLVTTN
jgi:hypothetical protein